MSRKIKVRAWDEDCGVMYYSDKEYDDCEFGFDKGVVVAWLRETEPQTLDEPAYDYGKSIETEECTGLKDKDGVEIYEGDIIKTFVLHKTSTGTYDLNVPSDIKIIAVEWVNHITVGFNLMNLKNNNYEVIGNLHQHPELLR